MKAVLFTREYPPEVYGGAGVHVTELTRHLATLIDVEVRCFGEPRPSERTGPRVRAFPTPPDVGGPAASALSVLAVDVAMSAGRDVGDVAHSHTWYANMAGHLAKLAHGIPHVMTSHSLEPLRPWKAEQLGEGGYRISSWCERTAIEAADAVIAVSGAMREDILRCYQMVDPARVEVIHNGIDPAVYRPDPGTDLLEALGVDPGRPFVAFVGRITRQKGLTHLLDAAAHIRDGAQLVLLAGAADTPEMEAEVAEKVRALGRARTGVVWVQRMATQAEIVQVLSHAAVFVCPSIYEPLGIVNLEAMACGAPVVASAVGGIPEVVMDGETGLLVPFDPGHDAFGSPRNPQGFAHSLAAAIDRLLEDPDLAERMGAAGRRRAVEGFGWRAVAERTVALYRRLLGR